MEGLAEAARAFGTPVVSGNVSLYNETGDRAIFPTPTVAMVGLIRDTSKVVGSWFRDPRDLVVLLGGAVEEAVGGSEYLKTVCGSVRGEPPSIDLEKEKRLAGLLIECASRSIIKSAHDISEGGFATALAECCFNPEGPRGVLVDSPGVNENSLRSDLFLFSETQSRVIASVDGRDWKKMKKMADDHGVPALLAGAVVDRDRFCVEGSIDMKISDAREAWTSGFEKSLSL